MTQRCISFGSLRVDAAVAAEMVERFQPLGVEASLAALEAHGREDIAKRRRWNWRWSRPASRRRWPDSNTTPSTPTTG